MPARAVVVEEHIIAIDASADPNMLFIYETLRFNDAGEITAWIPDDASIHGVYVMVEGGYTNIDFRRDGNLIYWSAPQGGSFRLQYSTSGAPAGILRKNVVFEKMLLNPANSMLLMVKTEKGKEVTSSLEFYNAEEQNGDVVWLFIGHEISGSVSASITWGPSYEGLFGYFGVAMVILLALAYPILRGRVSEIKKFERRAGLRKTPETLKTERQALLSILRELEDDYENGKLQSEQYIELKAEYKEKVMELSRRLDEYK